jgi:hypothetical protein
MDPTVAFAALPAGPAAAASSDYLDQLLGEINDRRVVAGTPSLVYASAEANQAVSQYLADLTPFMLARQVCFHGMNNPVAPAWDYVAASGFQAEPRGEVLACPDAALYWTAPQIANAWWSSASHFRLLYGDPGINALACGTYGPQHDGQVFETIACVTYRI